MPFPAPKYNPAKNLWLFFDPDLPPDNPSNWDDEFLDPFLNPTWIGITLSAATYDVNMTVPSCLWLEVPSAGTNSTNVLKPIPPGDFTIFTKISQGRAQGSTSANGGLGLILSDGVTAGAGNQMMGWANWNLANQPTLSIYTGVNFGSLSSGTDDYTMMPQYIALRRQGTTYNWGWSMDGKVWTWRNSNPGFTPAYFGLFIRTTTAGRWDFAFDFFRYFPSGNLPTLGGPRLGGWRSAHYV